MNCCARTFTGWRPAGPLGLAEVEAMSRAASPSRERIYGVARVTRDTIRAEPPNEMWATDQTKAMTVEDGEVTVAPAPPRAA